MSYGCSSRVRWQQYEAFKLRSPLASAQQKIIQIYRMFLVPCSSPRCIYCRPNMQEPTNGCSLPKRQAFALKIYVENIGESAEANRKLVEKFEEYLDVQCNDRACGFCNSCVDVAL